MDAREFLQNKSGRSDDMMSEEWLFQEIKSLIEYLDQYAQRSERERHKKAIKYIDDHTFQMTSTIGPGHAKVAVDIASGKQT